MPGTLDSKTTAASVALGILGFVATLSMLAFPPLLGQAGRFKEKAMLRVALITGIPTVCVVLYLCSAGSTI
ncbi:hypothetical protein NHF46_02825 [Arthrobacter alpinus]|nr:hypothetical protein [Arthrobacter alpinus]